MGHGESRPYAYDITQLTKEHFTFIQCIGKGGCGKVYKAIFKRSRRYVAIKQMSKQHLYQRKMITNAFNEKDILASLNHCFIANMYSSFQDHENLYLILDLLTGGDLRYYLSNEKRFTEEQIKFIIACIIISLEYLHSKGIVHRDIKPENILFDDRGYCRLTDFGIAKKVVNGEMTAIDASGTSGYIAPECIISNVISLDADYFSLGVVVYELCLGQKPYRSLKRYDIKDEYKSKVINVTLNDFPKNFTKNDDICDFINRLLKIKPSERLGHNGIYELKQHKWFSKWRYNWIDLALKASIPPFAPKFNEAIQKKDQDNDSSKDNNNKDNKAKDKEKDKENSPSDNKAFNNNNNNNDSFQKHFEHFTNHDFIKRYKEEKKKQQPKQVNSFNKTTMTLNGFNVEKRQQNSHRPKMIVNIKNSSSNINIINLNHNASSSNKSSSNKGSWNTPTKVNITPFSLGRPGIAMSFSVPRLRMTKKKGANESIPCFKAIQNIQCDLPLINKSNAFTLRSERRKSTMSKEKVFCLSMSKKNLFDL